jgi:hypothetical protein
LRRFELVKVPIATRAVNWIRLEGRRDGAGADERGAGI